MTSKARDEWDLRDELAATFMAAIVTGRYSEGRPAAVEGKAAARTAYDLAADFLAIRDELAREVDGAEAEDTEEP
jgi:hypothetical protein